MLLYLSSWQYISHILIILSLDIFVINIILIKMYSMCGIMKTIASGNKCTLNRTLILVKQYLETFLCQHVWCRGKLGVGSVI